MAVNRKQVGWISALIGILSIYILYTAYNIGSGNDLTACSGGLTTHIELGGAIALVASIAGVIAGYQRGQTLFYVYFAGVAVVVAAGVWEYNHISSAVEGSGGHPVPNRAFQEYSLGSYTGWLIGNNGSNWETIKPCLVSGHACDSMKKYSSDTAEQFFTERLTPVESGCCKPPTLCGFQIVNATSWIKPTNPGVDPDCAVWTDDGLCYDCSSCKAGFVESVKESWSGMGSKLLLGCVAAGVVGAVQFYLFTKVVNESGGQSKPASGSK